MTLSFILSVFPIILLIYLMVKRNALPSYVALPWIATLVMGVHLLHFNTDIVTISANVTAAIVAVQTPITVIFGAILFNKFSEVSGATDTMRKWLGNINPNPVAQFNYEFPSLVGGAIGLFISVFVANKGIGLAKVENKLDNNAVSAGQVAKALLPTGLLILFLIVTRIPELGLKGLMNNKDVWFSTALGSLGTFEVSKGLIFSLKNIFGSEVSESYKLLYVPALIPFVITVLISLPLFGVNFSRTKGIFSTSLSQVKNPFTALMGALVMVNLMLVGGEHSMVKIIGRTFAEVTGSDWTIFSSFLGAVGAFFSGSNTVSNLTFGSVQLSTAETTGLSVTLILALQSVGGAMGNMVCINNIVAVSSVLNIQNKEGTIIKTTIVPMVVYGIIAALCASFLIPLFYAL